MLKNGIFKKLLKSDVAFFTLLFGFITILFINAFSIHFFADDYFFLQISRAKNIGDFIHFYDPIRAYSYKPLASETFYFILHLLNTNVVLGHSIMFVTFFVGLFYFYKIICLLTKNSNLAKLTVFLYGISFIHVFQIYWFATYQEVALFCFLAVSFYHFIRKKYLLSILFFIFASFCKETAALYTPFLFLFTFFLDKGKIKIKNYYPLVSFVVLTIVFYSLYKYGLDHVTDLDNYKIEWNLRLLLNNAMWYGLWGAGFPSFMPDQFTHIFSKPLPTFWEILKIPDIKNYFYLLLAYWFIFIFSLISSVFLNRQLFKKYLLLFVFSLLSFFIFLGPILFFPHKWMIRLTMPLVYISFFEAYILYEMFRNNRVLKITAVLLIAIYSIWNFYGTKTHESASLYTLENDIYIQSAQYFSQHKNQITSKKYVYFKDEKINKNNIFENSQKLKLSYHDQSFLDHFFPGHTLIAVYNFESSKIPQDAYIVDTYQLLFNNHNQDQINLEWKVGN